MNEILRKTMMILGILFLAYGIGVIALIGTGGAFHFFYPLAGIFLILVSRYLKGKAFAVFTVLFLSFVLCFLYVEWKIISCSGKEADRDADYLIVLGSQVRDSGPSMDYAARLDVACDYLNENERTIVITTGGQGRNEPVSEGQGGRDYLMKKGIDASRILVEEDSRTTRENLENAKRIIEEQGDDVKDAKVVIVSALYHLYRASYIAGKLWFENVSCTGGCGLAYLLPQYFTREFFGVLKEWITLR